MKAKVGRSSPQEAGRAWNTGFSAGSENARKTITGGQSRSWVQGTLAAETAISSGISKAFASGAWRKGVQETNDAGWTKAMVDKGIPHMAAGSAHGEQHYAAFRAQWDPFVQQTVAGLPKRGTYEQNKARSGAIQDAFHNARGKYRGLWKRGMAG